MQTKCKKLLAMFLAVLMVVSALPMSVLAADETAAWEKVELSEIQAGDTIAITMYASATQKDYVLLNNGGTSTYGPAAVWDASKTDDSTWYWNIVSVDGGYMIYPAGTTASWLYCTNANNGLRVGDGEGGSVNTVWSLDSASGYLKCSDPDGNTRYMGVYDNNNGDTSAVAKPNFRVYKNTTGNTKNQTLAFYKLSGAGTAAPEPTPTPEPTPAPEMRDYELVSSLAEGDVVVLHNSGSGMMLSSEFAGYKLSGVAADPVEGVITTEVNDSLEWTVSIDEDGCYTFTQDNKTLGMVISGDYINMSTDASGEYTAWTLESSETDENVFYLKNTNMPADEQYGPYYLEYYKGFTAYSSNNPSDSAFGISFYKYVDETAVSYSTVAEALAGAEGEQFTVKGVVTLVDGKNIYVQDATGGICVRMSDTPADIALGDTIIAGGSKTVYNGLPQLGSGSYEKSSGMSLSAKDVSIGGLTEADICTYVHLENVEVTEVYDKNGQYSTPNITVTDGTNSIQLYKAVVGKTGDEWDVKVGDKLDILAAVSVYNTTYQLRNTLAEEITILSDDAEVVYIPRMTEAPAHGDTIVIYNSGNAMASEASGSKLAGIAAELNADNQLPLAEGMAQLLVSIDENGCYIFTLDGLYLTSAPTGNGLSFAEELSDCGKWTLEKVEGADAWYIKNVGANYNGNYNQAMEYYRGFTTYGIKSTEIYQMQLFLAEEADMIPDGTYVIWAPAYNMALSSNYTGFYNLGVEVSEEDGVLTGYGSSEIWTVTNNDDGSICISFEGQNLALADSYSSMTLGEVNDKWEVIDLGGDLYNVKNIVRGNFIEWYASKNNWSTYNSSKAATDGQFQLRFTPVEPKEGSGLPEEGEEVVLYNLSACGVLGAQNDNTDSPAINNVLSGIDENNVAYPEDGAVVFTVSRNGDYYRFYNETYGYLCSNGTGNNAFYSLEAGDEADWTVTEGKSGGYFLESRVAKFNGQYSQYLEYYADSYKTYSMYNVTDYDIYEFMFCPVDEFATIINGIVSNPTMDAEADAAYIGKDWVVTITANTVVGIKSIEFSVSSDPTVDSDKEVERKTLALDDSAIVVNGNVYTITVPASMVQEIYDFQKEFLGEEDMPGIALNAEIVFNDESAMSYGCGRDIIDEPSVGRVSPAAGTETGEDKRPTITAEILNAGEDAVVTMTVAGQEVDAVYADGMVSYTPSADLTDGRTSVTVTVTRADGKQCSHSWAFIVGEAQYELYFGQLHSHTTYSDGSGTLESALDYIASLPENANVDFVAFTDHSNYFDTTGSANPEGALYDMSLASADSQALWDAYVGAMLAFNASQPNVIAIPGFEMTWSGGPGHINTFNTPGIVSRNNSTLNNKTADAGMKAYYSLISQPEGVNIINQFNHPGTTFGNFTDFAYWDALVDTRIQLVEVGNGEGQVGAGGYYPSYEQYTMALDKGWHVAPTNNQDNHKGKWGNANDARDVIITDDFSLEGIYAAIRAMRVYATEDKNLEIGYTVNDMMMGSIIEEVPESLNVLVTVYDPDSSDSISKVEVIVNSGKVAYTWDDPADLADGELSAVLDPAYSYYYLRVTEGDGDIAVTAPVWVGESLKLGISAVETTTSTPVTDEELTISTTLFNSESTDAEVTSLVYTIGDEVIGTDSTGYTLPASGTLSVDFDYVPTQARLTTVTVTAYVTLEGVDYVFTMDIQLDVQDADKLVYIGIDASHYNEYVNGNYKDNMGNFSALAAEYNVRTVTLYSSEELIEACSNDKYVALILTAPSRRSAEAQNSDPLKIYTEEELAAIKAFNANGGTVIIAGWSDHYENYPDVDSIANMADFEHMAATQNALLEALGSSLRMGDDATYDDDYNGGQAYRLYFNTYNYDSFLVDGVEVDPENPHNRLYTEVYSHYGGASVYTVDGSVPASVKNVVFGHSGTYSVDVDKDGLGGDGMYKYESPEGDRRLVVLATEELPGQGLIVVSGAAFMSNFEVQATIEDSGSEKNYSNYKICENLLQYLNPVTITPIAQVQAQTESGYKYTIEGVVTSNASGYDKATAFFDCIYVQDTTGGICCFPVAGNFKVGDVVRVTGTTEFYQGEMELQVSSIEVIGSGSVEPTEVTASQVNDLSVIGQLITVSGEVVSFELANGLVQTIMVKDANGDIVRVFIDGYITTDKDVENLEVGADITVTGLASYDNTFNAPDGPFPRIRIRDRDDVVCTIVEFTVTFDSNGGSAVDSQTVKRGACATQPTDPSCSGCVFAGWYLDGEKYDFSAPVTADITLIAKWNTVGTVVPDEPDVPDQPDVPDEPDVPEWPFTDVTEDDWFYQGVHDVYYGGIMNGISEDEFAPELKLSRAMLATMLYRLSGETYEGDAASFADVAQGQWYSEAIAWAAANGIVTGYSETEFRPEQNVTREQTAVMLYRYAKYKGLDVSVGETTKLDSFADADEISAYALAAMQWAVGAGIINGVSENSLAPAFDSTRAQAATMFSRYMNWCSAE